MNVIHIKIFFCAFVLAVLISCSMPRVLYNNADLLLLNWFDAHFELNEQQHSGLKKGIENLFNWHRKSELPKIILFLEELRLRYAKGIKQKDIDWASAQLREFWERVLHHFEDDLVSFLLTIEENQILQMEKELIERNDQLIKESRMNSNELHAHKLDWLYGVFEDWLGDLKPNQKQKMGNWVEPDTYWVSIKLKNRKKFENDLIHLLQFKELLKENLNAWILRPESHWTEEFKAHFKDKKQEWADIILKVDAITMPDQRTHGMNELQGYIDDFRVLARVKDKR